MKVIIDRFEEDIAVVELDGKMLNAPRALFAEAREGDTVEITVLPRQTDDSQETSDDDKARRVQEATRRFFNAGKESEDDAKEESPAALFAKLRAKKKKHD